MNNAVADSVVPHVEPKPLVELKKVTKSYGGVCALRDINLSIRTGEIHAVCGENGAGKSTLIRLLCGLLKPDDGQIFVAGQPMNEGSVRLSESMGIAVMHQESAVFPHLTATENVFAGREITTCGGLILKRHEMNRRTEELLSQLGEALPLSVPVRELTLAQRQFVSLARALSQDCRLLIMDEPTASLSGRETQTLLRLIRELRSRGVSILYVSHRLEEVFAVADRITVLRDGSLISTHSTQELNPSELIRLMVGRNLPPVEKKRPNELSQTPVVMDVRNLSSSGRFQNISFQLHRGEVLGLAGLVGAGRTEIARAIFGIDDYSNGDILINERRLPARSVAASVEAGLAMVPEDRQHQGLILQMCVSENLSIVILNQLTNIGIIRKSREHSAVQEQTESLQVRCHSSDVAASSLSGGNQQKLVLGKWLANSPKILLLDEPTRGIDVGAKAQVHSIIRQLSESGMATLLISSEMQELLTVCDRILVIRNGQVSDNRPVANWTQEELLAHSLPDGDSAAEAETKVCGDSTSEPHNLTHAPGDHP